jgi:hypothetical protein
MEKLDDREKLVRGLLHEAGALHHTVWRIADGDDPDWASWYADWLINLSELPVVLGRRPVRSELVYHLVRLGKEYSKHSTDEPWEAYYARALVASLSA